MLAALLSLLLATGCGGGELSGQATTSTAAETTPPAATAPATTSTPAATTTAPADPPPTTTATTPATTQKTTTTPAQTTTQASGGSTTPPSKPAPDQPVEHAIDETAQVSLVEKISPTHFKQRGTVTGTFDGEMELEARLTNAGVRVDFTVNVPGSGTVTGRSLALLQITGAALEPITGTVMLTGGTGDFADVRGRGLKVSGKVALDGSRGVVHLTGTAYY
ncbi:MAG: hypothetical protein WBC33_04280 [Conexibacter sp.]